MKLISLFILLIVFTAGCASREKNAEFYAGGTYAASLIAISGADSITTITTASNQEKQYGSADSYGVVAGWLLSDRIGLKAIYDQASIESKVKNQFFGLGADFRVLGEFRIGVVPGLNTYSGRKMTNVLFGPTGSDPFTSAALAFNFSYDFFIIEQLSLAPYIQTIAIFHSPSMTVADLFGASLKFWF